MNTLIRLVCLALYYYGARFLPEHSMPRGMIWCRIRVFLCRRFLRHCGKGVQINRGAHFGKGDEFSMGDYSSLGINARIIGPVTFGNYVSTAQDVFVTTSNREFSGTDKPMMFQGKRPDKPVVIEDDCIIFANAIILPGVTIHTGCIIGAAAVVAKDVPPNSVVAGNPAQVVRFRVPPPPDYDFSGMIPIACEIPKPAP
jgi:maltose O-acetyltransferase